VETISYNIAVASDHRGLAVKSAILKQLKSLKHNPIDLGTDSEESVDYPDFAHKLTDHISDGFSEIGILVCGTGIGMSIAANRNSEMRAALCTSPTMAQLARAHNNANILVIGAKISTPEEIKQVVEAFLNTTFEGGRHSQRLAKIR
jgi:ribose 5-phosphate isomerase B